MYRLTHGLLSMVLSAPAWAANEPSNVTATTWEIYGFVAVVFLMGFSYVLWSQEKEKKRKKRRESRSSNPA